jgi:hypothetical protein
VELTFEQLAHVAGRFTLDGHPAAATPFPGGHIHDSYLLTMQTAATRRRFLLQCINTAVLPDPARLMQNIQRITAHIAPRLRAAGVPDLPRRVLSIVPARDGLPYARDAAGSYWRVYHFIENSRVHETVQTPAQAEDAGRAFGRFLDLLHDFPAEQLHDTIPDFHNTPLRLAALEQAVAEDTCGRVRSAGPELDFARQHRALAPTLANLLKSGALPTRVVHNDAKISNVLFDAVTGQELCVVDLDIVMPGTALYDFGDMVRSMTSTAAEDEPDTATVKLSLALFAALARGYLATAGPILNADERKHLVLAGQLITLEQGLRFLTDFLRGDTYYKTSRPHHNLDRARTQFKLLADLTHRENELRHATA